MRAWIDSDILIWHLRGSAEATGLLRRLDSDASLSLWTGAMQRAEIVFFMRPEEESATLALLSRIQVEPVTAAVVDRAGALYRRWHPSHGIDVNDALLAAMALQRGGRVYTRNVKHFPHDDLVVVPGW